MRNPADVELPLWGLSCIPLLAPTVQRQMVVWTWPWKIKAPHMKWMTFLALWGQGLQHEFQVVHWVMSAWSLVCKSSFQYLALGFAMYWRSNLHLVVCCCGMWVQGSTLLVKGALWKTDYTKIANRETLKGRMQRNSN